MRAFPIKMIRKLIQEVVSIAQDSGDVGFEFELTGGYGIDKAGEFSLGTALGTVLPIGGVPADVEIDASMSREFESQGAGGFTIRIWSKQVTPVGYVELDK